MGQLLEEALTPGNLDLTWRRLKNDRTRWDSTTSREDMAHRHMYHVLQLAEELKAGTYKPGSLRQFTIAKTNGKRRMLSALYLRDKFAQRAILQIIEPIGEHEFDDDSFGYRPGRSVSMAMTRAQERIDCGMDWLLDADLEKFFDTIPHKPLMRAMSGIVNDKAVLALMENWLRQTAPTKSTFGQRQGIAQGAVLSPFQCNTYLTQLDRYWRNKGIPFVRFADDFLLFADSKASAELAFALTGGKLKAMKINYNLEKTHVVRASKKVEFLGQRLRSSKMLRVG